MKLLKFLGHSDDVFQYGVGERATGGDETYSINGIHSFLVKDSGGEGLYVCGAYAPDAIPGACWVVGVAQIDEDIPLPHWAMRYENGMNGYSPVLVIQAPDDVKVEPVKKD